MPGDLAWAFARCTPRRPMGRSATWRAVGGAVLFVLGSTPTPPFPGLRGGENRDNHRDRDYRLRCQSPIV
eukprot:7850763-Pyramimonas_sp.AAC.1